MSDNITFDTIVIGTGAAGFNAAGEIKKACTKSVCIVTEDILCGTSRNTGSDKQTYYKLTLSGNTDDSVYKMAENLFAGGSVDGDTALCEAALSAKCFLNLCSLGVEFPTNRYGEYVGYKTDHDPYMRATSAGPLTSKFMTEALEKQAEKLEIPVFDRLTAIKILTFSNKVCGLLCFDKKSLTYKAFRCNNIILAVGGPAGIYSDTVYPDGHTGALSLAIEAGAKLQNMTEWQYGLSSKNPKWNVSGTYMQVLPRFVSVDENGNEYEFLSDYFKDIYEALSFVFLKGYQWPFDSKKAKEGSSRIDLAVYRECTEKHRKVYLDFTKNPFGLKNIDYKRLSDECYTYLSKAEALFGTPIERLLKMNSPAVELYKSKGRDITKEYLEIALCAQHLNGGISVNLWWETSVRGLFAAGECAGTHGITRPGGSALNAGQAGSLRAATYISQKEENFIDEITFSELIINEVDAHLSLQAKISSDESNIDSLLNELRTDMSSCAAAVRDTEKIRQLSEKTEKQIKNFHSFVKIRDKAETAKVYKFYDALITADMLLRAIIDYYESFGINRGSAIYIPEKQGDINSTAAYIQEISRNSTGITALWRKVRPIPKDDDFFENVWRRYRENKNIY